MISFYPGLVAIHPGDDSISKDLKLLITGLYLASSLIVITSFISFGLVSVLAWLVYISSRLVLISAFISVSRLAIICSIFVG
jgi:hypothetical protein